MADGIVEVELPDGRIVEFPADTSREVMSAAIQRLLANEAQPAQPAAPERPGLIERVVDNVVGLDNNYTSAGERTAQALNVAGDSMLFNYGDEIGARADAIVGRGTYDERLDFYRAQEDTLAEEAPGLNVAARVGGAVAGPGLGAAGFIGRGANWLSRVARSAVAGAGTGAVASMGDTEGGLADRIASAPIGAAIGAAGGAVAVPVAAAAGRLAQRVSSMMRNRNLFRNGQMTEAGRDVLRRAGLDPDNLPVEIQRTIAGDAARAADPVEGARAAGMAEFGIPAYRHNVTGAVDDAALFERARRGGMGPSAATRVGQAADDQFAAARRAGETIATDLSGGAIADQGDAASAAITGLRAAQDAARGQAQAAYEALEAAGGGVRGTALQGIGERVQNTVRMNNVRLTPQLTPNAISAVDDINEMLTGADRGSASFMDLERVRQNLVQLRGAAYRGSLGADQRAMDSVIDAFDEQVDSLMTTAMTEGDDAALGLAREARAMWSQYRRQFLGKDAGARFIQRMVAEDASPDDAARWLFSAGKLGSGQFNSSIAQRLRETLGDGSPEWNAIRQGAFRQLAIRPEGATQLGPQRVATNITNFFKEPTTRQLASELFTEQERGLMLRYAAALNRMVPPAGAVNYSNTAYESNRMAQQLMRGIAASLGFAATGGNALGAMAAGGAASAVQGAAGGAAVRQALSPVVQRPVTNVLSGAAGALTSQATPSPQELIPRQ
jgi:hypothetical protein